MLSDLRARVARVPGATVTITDAGREEPYLATADDTGAAGVTLDARLVLATNENDVLDEFFRTGRYRPRASAETWEFGDQAMPPAPGCQRCPLAARRPGNFSKALRCTMGTAS